MKLDTTYHIEECIIMNIYLKIIGIQFLALIFGGMLLEILFDIPEWLSLVIVGLIFFGTYFAVQIRCSINKSSGEVSSDGIAGARLCGIFISSILLPFILGIYIYQAINIIMILAGVLLLLICRKNISSFFFENKWKKIFWMIYLGCLFLLCGVFSIFACMDIAPCIGLKGVPRIVAIGIWAIVVRSTLPPNTLLSRFATNNYKINANK